MKYDPDLTSLEVRRKEIRGDFANPTYTQFYTVALADIALGLHYMHTAKLIHGDLKVDDCAKYMSNIFLLNFLF